MAVLLEARCCSSRRRCPSAGRGLDRRDPSSAVRFPRPRTPLYTHGFGWLALRPGLLSGGRGGMAVSFNTPPLSR